MANLLDKFTKNIKKLEDYYILGENDSHLLVGTQITIKRHHEVLNNVFQPYTSNKDIDFNVFFVIPFKDAFPELEFYKNKNIPLLRLTKKILFSKDEKFCIKTCLDDFVELKIKS